MPLKLHKIIFFSRKKITKKYEPQSLKPSLNDEVVNIWLLHILNLQSVNNYSATFMKLSSLFMELWSFEIIHCLNFNTQCQKCHDVTNDVKVNFLICEWMKDTLFLANIVFIIHSMCVMEFAEIAEKLTLIHFCLKFAWSRALRDELVLILCTSICSQILSEKIRKSH